MVALSFVQSAADVRQAREIIALADVGEVPLIAKLERPQASTIWTRFCRAPTA